MPENRPNKESLSKFTFLTDTSGKHVLPDQRKKNIGSIKNEEMEKNKEKGKTKQGSAKQMVKEEGKRKRNVCLEIGLHMGSEGSESEGIWSINI